MEEYTFVDGGAFPEIHVAQFPLGLGKVSAAAPASAGATAGHAASANTYAAASSTALTVTGPNIAQTAAGALTTKHFTAAELRRPSAEEAARTAETTRQHLALALRAQDGSGAGLDANGADSAGVEARTTIVTYAPQLGLERTIAVVGAARDPLDPSKQKAKKLAREAIGDPAPIIRSPTKRGGGSGAAAAAFFMPPAVSNFRNPGNVAIPLEQRLAADGRRLADHSLAASHFDTADALRRAEEELDARFQHREVTRQAADDARTSAQDEALAAQAAAVLRDAAAARAAEAARARDETPAERAERLRAAADDRERQREVERRHRRLERTAQRLGVSLAEAEARDVAAGGGEGTGVGFDSVDDGGHPGTAAFGASRGAKPQGGGGGADYDGPLYHRGTGIGGRHDRDRLAREAELQQRGAAAAAAPAAADDGEEDVFGLQLSKKRRKDD